MSQTWTADEIRRVGRLVVDLIADHLSTLPDEPVFRPVPSGLAQTLLTTPPPQDPVSPDEVLRRFRETIEPYPFGNGHPRFWGWVNSPPAVMGVFAEALAAAMNPSCAGGNHAAIYVEHQVLNWFREMLGFPAASGGLLVSGGSMATMTALAVARHVKSGVDFRIDGLREAPAAFAFYMSSEAHSCARKAIERHLDEDAIAALNRRLLERLQLGGEAFLTSTELRGRYTLRACIVNDRSRREDVDRMLDTVRAIGREITLHDQ